MILDDALHIMACLAVFASLATGRSLFPALVVFVSLEYNAAIFIESPTWSEFIRWAILFAAKDLLFLTLLGFRRTTTEFIIALSFLVSCLFHQAILAQVLTYDPDNLTLFAIRPQLMMYVTVAQLATVFYIIISGSGINGGKRVKSYHAVRHFRSNGFFHSQAFKAYKK